MMENETAAKVFLSAIIEEEVLEISDAAQERDFTVHPPLNNREEKDEKLFLSIDRFNFYAKISVPGAAFKTVMIELQKAKFPQDVMRFRCYPGSQTPLPINTGNSKTDQKHRCCFYRIFLLSRNINIPDTPIVYVDYSFKDAATKEQVDSTNEFLRSLDYRSWIIQLDQLKQHRRSNIEKLLNIFTQEKWTSEHHILSVNEDKFPQKYHPVIQCLHIASQNKDIRKAMEQEDEFMQEILS
jgi:hypothetical protein